MAKGPGQALRALLRKLMPQAVLGRLRSRPRLRKVAGNTAWLYTDQLLRMGLGFLVGTYVARYLGPDQYGLYNFAIATVAVVSSVTSLGLDTIVVKRLSQQPEQAGAVLGSGFLLRLVGGAAGFVVAVGFALATRPAGSPDRAVMIIIASTMLFQAFDIIDLWFQSRLESKFTVAVKASAYVAVSLVRVALVLGRASVVAFAWVGLLEVLAGALGLLWIYTRQGQRLWAWAAELKLAAQLLAESWPLMINGFAIYIQARIDQLLLGQMLGNHELGLYSAAVRVSEVFNFVPVALTTSLFPALAITWTQDPALAKKRLVDLYRLMTWITVAIALPISLFARPVLWLLYGARFSGAEGILALFVWSRFFTAFGVARGIVIAAEGRFRYSMAGALVGSALNVGLNLLLIPRYGAMGSVVAMMASFALTIFGMDLLYKPMRPNLKAMLQGIFTFTRLAKALWQ